MSVPVGAKILATIKGASTEIKERVERHGALICANAGLSSMELTEDPVRGSAQVIVGDLIISLPLAGVVDLSKESERLKKEIAKLDLEIAGIIKKLANKSFVSKAPSEVVKENRERQVAKTAERTKLSEALSRISAV